MHVLYVEDDRRLREMTTSYLFDRGIEVSAQARCDAAAAFLGAAAALPDALITDIETPGLLDGWGLAELARGLHPALPVIYTTGCDEVRERRVPGSILLRKPFRARALVDALNDRSAVFSFAAQTAQPGALLCDSTRDPAGWHVAAFGGGAPTHAIHPPRGL